VTYVRATVSECVWYGQMIRNGLHYPGTGRENVYKCILSSRTCEALSACLSDGVDPTVCTREGYTCAGNKAVQCVTSSTGFVPLLLEDCAGVSGTTCRNGGCLVAGPVAACTGGVSNVCDGSSVVNCSTGVKIDCAKLSEGGQCVTRNGNAVCAPAGNPCASGGSRCEAGVNILCGLGSGVLVDARVDCTKVLGGVPCASNDLVCSPTGALGSHVCEGNKLVRVLANGTRTEADCAALGFRTCAMGDGIPLCVP
jgi:hypothetical protein